MAHTKSSIKDLKRTKKRTTRNRGLKSKMRTSVKKARTTIDSGKDDPAVSMKSAIEILDKMVSKGIIHPNNAARKKSRLIQRHARIVLGVNAPKPVVKKKVVGKPTIETEKTESTIGTETTESTVGTEITESTAGSETTDTQV